MGLTSLARLARAHHPRRLSSLCRTSLQIPPEPTTNSIPQSAYGFTTRICIIDVESTFRVGLQNRRFLLGNRSHLPSKPILSEGWHATSGIEAGYSFARFQGSRRCLSGSSPNVVSRNEDFSSSQKRMGLGSYKILSKSVSLDSITSNLKRSPDFAKQPVEFLKTTTSRYKEAAGLQVEAFWKRNVMILVGAAGVLSCFLLWQLMYGVANMFVSFSEGMAKFGFLAMAAATVAFTAMALRARYIINPDKVYRIVMRMLNTSAAALEVLGPPLTGTDLRAYVMSGGGLRLKNFKPRLASRRCFLIFPIHGSERKGLVSVEVKKKKGKYDFKLLAIDVAIPGAEQRIYLAGDEAEYNIGGGLIAQLRDPIFKAIAAQGEFDAQDEKEQHEEEKAEEARRVQEIKEKEARRNEEIARLERESQNT